MTDGTKPGCYEGICDLCGRQSGELVLGAGCMAMYGFPVHVCPECNRRMTEQVRRRYMMAGEQTEPAE